jgi:hypothetical protein
MKKNLVADFLRSSYDHLCAQQPDGLPAVLYLSALRRQPLKILAQLLQFDRRHHPPGTKMVNGFRKGRPDGLNQYLVSGAYSPSEPYTINS